jgi:hypothetical protein
MVISISAGWSLDTVMLEVIHLTGEFNQVLNEMRMDVSRRDALQSFAHRTDLSGGPSPRWRPAGLPKCRTDSQSVLDGDSKASP